MTDKTQPTAHAEITAPISADLRRLPELSEQDAGLLEQAASMLEGLHNDERNRGNCSTAEGAACSADAVRRLAVQLLRAAPPAPAAANYSGLLNSCAPAAPAALAVPEGLEQIRIGCLPTMTQDDYPGLGDWWVQLRIGNDGDEVLARVYGSSPEQAHARAAALAAAPAQAWPSECDSPELCRVHRGCAGQYGTKKTCHSFAVLNPCNPAAPAQAVASGMWTIWEALPGYLIDHCEGDIISEEGLQRALEAMLKNPQYSMPPAAAAPAPKATGTAHLPYFSYDEDAGVQFWATRERAIKECQDAIDAYREDVEDGWSDDVESVRWGVVLGRAVKTDERPDQSCDYALTPYAAPAQEHATQLAAPALRPYISHVQSVADLVNNLLLLDQTLPIYGAQYIEHPPGKRRAITAPPTVSRERVKDSRWIGEGDILNAAVIWTRAEQPAAPAQAQEDALDVAELEEVQRAISDFADCGETDVDYALLMRAAQAGYLECTHFQVMNESALNLDAARAAQGGAA